jgi:hypothetical protein
MFQHFFSSSFFTSGTGAGAGDAIVGPPVSYTTCSVGW